MGRMTEQRLRRRNGRGKQEEVQDDEVTMARLPRARSRGFVTDPCGSVPRVAPSSQLVCMHCMHPAHDGPGADQPPLSPDAQRGCAYLRRCRMRRAAVSRNAPIRIPIARRRSRICHG